MYAAVSLSPVKQKRLVRAPFLGVPDGSASYGIHGETPGEIIAAALLSEFRNRVCAQRHGLRPVLREFFKIEIITP